MQNVVECIQACASWLVIPFKEGAMFIASRRVLLGARRVLYP